MESLWESGEVMIGQGGSLFWGRGRRWNIVLPGGRVLLFIHRTSANICFVKEKKQNELKKKKNKKVQTIHVPFIFVFCLLNA